MALLYDENFQSYALGQIPPYADFQKEGLNAIIRAGGGYGDTQDCGLDPNAGIVYPILPPNSAFTPTLNTYSKLGVPAYTNFSISMYINQASNADQQGQFLTIQARRDANGGQDLAAIRLLTDGTLAIVSPAGSAFSVPQAISDFSLHTNTVYWLQVNASFGASGGFMTANITVAVNGIPVVSFSWTTGEPLSSIEPYGYSGNFWNTVKLSGAGIGNGHWSGEYLQLPSVHSVISAHPGSSLAEGRIDRRELLS